MSKNRTGKSGDGKASEATNAPTQSNNAASGRSNAARPGGPFRVRSTDSAFCGPARAVRPLSQKRSGNERAVHVVEYGRGRAVLQVGSQRERFVAEREPLEQIVIGDYLRARQGFASDVEMAEVLGVHRTRVAAWKLGRLPDAVNTQLLAAVAVTVHALVQFLDPEVVADWLTTDAEELGGVAPVEALRQGRLAEVLQLANATEHGAYL